MTTTALEIPEELLRNPHFARYYRTWQRNEFSIVFIPLAQMCREQSFLAEARTICEKGLIHHPNSVSGRLMLARIYLDLEDLKQSQEIVRNILEEFPGQQEALTLLARIQGMTPEPEEENEESTEIDAVKEQNQPQVGIEVSQSFRENSQKESTLSTKSTTSLWENVTMAKIYADQGERKTARQILDRILVRNPSDSRALELAKVLQ